MYTVVPKQVKCTDEPINILGITATHDKDLQIKLNYDKVIEKIQGIFNSWVHRNLSILGKVIIINTLVASLFVYKMSVLPLLPKTYLEKIEKSCVNFIWNGRKSKIALKKLQNAKHLGGLGLTNFANKDKALKLQWVKTIHENEELIALMQKVLGIQIGNLIWKCN